MKKIMKIDLPNDEDDFFILESMQAVPAKVVHVFDIARANKYDTPYDKNFDEFN